MPGRPRQEQHPLILLPGMGADRRLFQEQARSLENLLVPEWIAPQQGDTLSGYARRMAGVVDPGCPCFLGGASFGGMVALEMVPHLQTKACFLIGSVRSPREFPRRVRMLRPLPSRILGFLIRFSPTLARWALALRGRGLRPATCSLLRQLADTDPRFLDWAVGALLRWKPTTEPLPVPVFQIHGDRDWVLPSRQTTPDLLVPGAGHLLSMTFPEPLNEFLRSHMERLAR